MLQCDEVSKSGKTTRPVEFQVLYVAVIAFEYVSVPAFEYVAALDFECPWYMLNFPSNCNVACTLHLFSKEEKRFHFILDRVRFLHGIL